MKFVYGSRELLEHSEWASRILANFFSSNWWLVKSLRTELFLWASFLLGSNTVSGSVLIARRTKCHLHGKRMSDRQHIMVTSLWFSFHLLITIRNRLCVIAHWGVSWDKNARISENTLLSKIKKQTANSKLPKYRNGLFCRTALENLKRDMFLTL